MDYNQNIFLHKYLYLKIPLAQSEVHISDILDNICEKMSDYVRATYKSNGQLTILNLMSPSGSMNPEMSKVDIIQDGDLNKSLKYYVSFLFLFILHNRFYQLLFWYALFQCEGIVEEFEDSMISLFIRKENDIKEQLCTNVSKLCNSTDVNEDDEDNEENDINEEHYEL